MESVDEKKRLPIGITIARGSLVLSLFRGKIARNKTTQKVTWGFHCLGTRCVCA